MKILSTNLAATSVKSSYLSGTNFKGLWGHQNVSCVTNDCGYVYSSVRNYYPFKDEIVKEFPQMQKHAADWTNAGTYIREFYSIDVHTPLSFSAEEYKIYKNFEKDRKASGVLVEAVEKELINRDLLKYLNADGLEKFKATQKKLLVQKRPTFDISDCFKKFFRMFKILK